MSERLDKAERARFLAVMRLRQSDERAADTLDSALLLEDNATGAISLSLVDSQDSEAGEMEAAWMDSASEDAISKRLTDMIRSRI